MFSKLRSNFGIQFFDDAKRATVYGVHVSYIPALRKMDDLLFGNPFILRNIGEHEEELHVDRKMNVWGSGGAHAEYFNIIDQIIIELFNRPIAEQPIRILDMGCGNGAFLQHLKKRSPFVDRFGLLLIELHTIAPELTANNLGRTAATAYDATHGLSDQSIVELHVLHKIAVEARLFSDASVFTKFPNSDFATVSVNLLNG